MAVPQRTMSPAGEALTARRQAKEKDGTFKADKNSRRFAASVERALGLFDIQEWADYISFLGRLLKALQSHPQGTSILPHKTLVARRLAQCLDPKLPSGVHQKTLEVYDFLFSLIGRDGLAANLALFLPGISSTLTFASLTVRPLFLSLVEKHLLNLSSVALRPALKAIILSILPGLEEESSEDFDRILQLLNRLKEAVAKESDSPILQRSTNKNGDGEASQTQYSTIPGSEYFWQSLFLASITSPTRRQGVLAYLTRYLPKMGMQDAGNAIDIEIVTSPEPGVLLRCFASGLLDRNQLIQRGFLDILVSHLPLHSPTIQSRVNAKDLVVLVDAAIRVALRRDMSLNRRLWTWLLGPDEQITADRDGNPLSPDARSANEAQPNSPSNQHSRSTYFKTYGADPLISALRNMINTQSTIPSDRARPFRIALSLMDRWEVGSALVSAIFLPLMESLRDFQHTASSAEDFEEVFRSANSFFDGVEGTLVWSEILDLLDSLSTGQETGNRLNLAKFILDHFNVQGEDMVDHLPLVCLALAVLIQKARESTSLTYAQKASEVLNDLMDILPKNSARGRTEAVKGSATLLTFSKEPEQILSSIRNFYSQGKIKIDVPLPPVDDVFDLLTQELIRMIKQNLNDELHGPLLRDRILTLRLLLVRKRSHEQVQQANFADDLIECLKSKATSAFMPLPLLASITSLATLLYSSHHSGALIPTTRMQEIIHHLVGYLWVHLSPTQPQHHVETVRSLWQLQTVAWKWRTVESRLSDMMISRRNKQDVESESMKYSAVESFNILWTLSNNLSLSSRDGYTALKDSYVDANARYSSMLQRPLLIAIDFLSQPLEIEYQPTLEWIRSLSFSSLETVFLAVLVHKSATRPTDPRQESSSETGIVVNFSEQMPSKIDLTTTGNIHQFQWAFKGVSHILSAISPEQWSGLAQTHMSATALSLLQQPLQMPDLQKTLFVYLVELTVQALRSEELLTNSLNVLQQLARSPVCNELVETNVEVEVVSRLEASITQPTHVQAQLLETVSIVLKITMPRRRNEVEPRRSSSKDFARGGMRISTSSEKAGLSTQVSPISDTLLDCLLRAISSRNTKPILDKWTRLFCDCLPLFSGIIFQNLLNINGCFCKEIRACFDALQNTFANVPLENDEDLPKTMSTLLVGLEACLAYTHDQLLISEESIESAKTPEPTQGFFGTVVSGVFGDRNQIRNAVANNRLTVILCFQDAIRACFTLWSWELPGLGVRDLAADSTASFRSIALKLKNRSRRILEGLFAVEPLECLETAIELWQGSWSKGSEAEAKTVLNLLHTLDGSRPTNAIPAIFNATYSRTNPTALDPSRKSSVTANLSDTDMMTFLVSYTKSLEDDVLEEIWVDCTTFLRDVLGNPMPQRQILPRLLEFVGIIGSKMENTNFGEEWKMRKELGDLFLRLLTAIFTIKPAGLSQDQIIAKGGRTSHDLQNAASDNVVQILFNNFASFTSLLGETDRLMSAVSSISISLIAPTLKSRVFPQNLSSEFLQLAQRISRVPGASRYWRREINDAFSDNKFFQTPLPLIETGWLSLLRQLMIVDKDRITELLSRLTAPATAGIMFGVGATAARVEADRKTQQILRRIAILILASEQESYVGALPQILTKLDELSAATHVTSPSSATRSELFMVLRALVLQCSPIHLASFWSFISGEVYKALSSLLPEDEAETYTLVSVLQAAKLLDLLLFIRPDEFQLQEWLFITDTVDAIYRPDDWVPVALADELSITMNGSGHPSHHLPSNGLTKPLLCSDATRDAGDLLTILQPFFSQLSIHAFETTYKTLGAIDYAACREDLLADLFHESEGISVM